LQEFLEEVQAEDAKQCLLLEEQTRKVSDLLVQLVSQDAGQADGGQVPSWVHPLQDDEMPVADLGLGEMSGRAEQSLLSMISSVNHGLGDWPKKVLQSAKDDEVRTSALPAPASQHKTSSLFLSQPHLSDQALPHSVPSVPEHVLPPQECGKIASEWVEALMAALQARLETSYCLVHHLLYLILAVGVLSSALEYLLAHQVDEVDAECSQLSS